MFGTFFCKERKEQRRIRSEAAARDRFFYTQPFSGSGMHAIALGAAIVAFPIFSRIDFQQVKPIHVAVMFVVSVSCFLFVLWKSLKSRNINKGEV